MGWSEGIYTSDDATIEVYQEFIGCVNVVQHIREDALELLGQELLIVPPLAGQEFVVVAGDVRIPSPVLDDIVISIAQMTHIRFGPADLIILDDLVTQLCTRAKRVIGLHRTHDQLKGQFGAILTSINVFSFSMSLAEGSRAPCLANIQNLTGSQSTNIGFN